MAFRNLMFWWPRLSLKLNLSDFPHNKVYFCYDVVSAWKLSMELDTLDENNQSKLEVAVENGYLLMVLVLLENGCTHMKDGYLNLLDIPGGYVHEWTPLTVAVNDARLRADSRREIVIFLLQFDQDLDVRDEQGRTAAHWATFHGFPDILEAFLLKKADVQAEDDERGSLMGYAINQWINIPEISIDLVNVLLEADFDVDTMNADGNTPLHLAVLAESRDIAVILLRWGADKSLPNEEGDTPLDIATNLGARNMSSLLSFEEMVGG
jgi:ankyrin repeat protein